MEEKSNIGEQNEQKQPEETKTQISLSAHILNASFAMIALIMLAVALIVLQFNINGAAVFRGIMSIFVYGFAVLGLVWNIIKNKNFTPEFWLSAAVVYMAFRFL